MQNKENTTFLALLRPSFCTEIDSKIDLKHILKRLFRDGLISVQFSSQNKTHESETTLKNGQNLVFNSDRFMKKAYHRYHEKI